MKQLERKYSAAELRLRELIKESGGDPDAVKESPRHTAKKNGAVMGYKTYMSRATTSDRPSTLAKKDKEMIVREYPGVIIKESFYCCLCSRKHFGGYEYADDNGFYFQVCSYCRNNLHHGKARPKEDPYPFRN